MKDLLKDNNNNNNLIDLNQNVYFESFTGFKTFCSLREAISFAKIYVIRWSKEEINRINPEDLFLQCLLEGDFGDICKIQKAKR